MDYKLLLRILQNSRKKSVSVISGTIRLPVTVSNRLVKLGKFVEYETKIIFRPDRLTFLKKHQILFMRFIDDFSRNSVSKL